MKSFFSTLFLLTSVSSFAFVDCNLQDGQKLSANGLEASVEGLADAQKKFSYTTRSADWIVYYDSEENVELRVYKQFPGREGYKGVEVFDHERGQNYIVNCK